MHIQEFMDADHAHVDHLWSDFLAEKHNPQKALELCKKFYSHIKKHIDIEDNVLFPRFDEFTGLSTEEGPTYIARRDHTSILKLIKQVEDACTRNDVGEIERVAEHLGKALHKHRERENLIQYPVLDSFIPDEEWSTILEHIYGTADMSLLYAKHN
ncbi:MAG: hemerythrin domain-containing protein [Candidatus Magasanikbacteria bacterium]